MDTDNGLLVYVLINDMAEKFSEMGPTIIYLKEKWGVVTIDDRKWYIFITYLMSKYSCF